MKKLILATTVLASITLVNCSRDGHVDVKKEGKKTGTETVEKPAPIIEPTRSGSGAETQQEINSRNAQANAQAHADKEEATNKALKAKLDGVIWESKCEAVGVASMFNGNSQRYELEFNAVVNSFKLVRVSYEEELCKTRTGSTIARVGRYEVGETSIDGDVVETGLRLYAAVKSETITSIDRVEQNGRLRSVYTFNIDDDHLSLKVDDGRSELLGSDSFYPKK